MSTCVNTHALVSALAGRVEREGYRPTRADFTGLLGAGCKRADVEAALAKAGDAFAHARAVLAETPDPPPRKGA
jgi:hypothetical protein